jgi:predicted phosphodiesterase
MIIVSMGGIGILSDLECSLGNVDRVSETLGLMEKKFNPEIWVLMGDFLEPGPKVTYRIHEKKRYFELVYEKLAKEIDKFSGEKIILPGNKDSREIRNSFDGFNFIDCGPLEISRTRFYGVAGAWSPMIDTRLDDRVERKDIYRNIDLKKSIGELTYVQDVGRIIQKNEKEIIEYRPHFILTHQEPSSVEYEFVLGQVSTKPAPNHRVKERLPEITPVLSKLKTILVSGHTHRMKISRYRDSYLMNPGASFTKTIKGNFMYFNKGYIKFGNIKSKNVYYYELDSPI